MRGACSSVRSLQPMTTLSDPPIVVIYGGNGFFGRLIVKDLLVRTIARIVVASRSSPHTANLNSRVGFILSDLNDPASVRSTLAGASVVVHCAGPYQSQAPTVMHEAIASGVHYIDLAENREFVREAQRSNEAATNADVTLLSGLSVVPGLAALFAGSLMDKFDEVLSIRTFVAPGTRGSRGIATIRSLLGGTGRPLHLLREGREVTVRGWSESEWINFRRRSDGDWNIWRSKMPTAMSLRASAAHSGSSSRRARNFRGSIAPLQRSRAGGL